MVQEYLGGVLGFVLQGFKAISYGLLILFGYKVSGVYYDLR